MAELSIDNLTVRAGGATLVDAASLTLSPGEFTVLLGPNGAGKTSLIRAALGLQAASAGTATLDGTDMAALDPAARARAVSYLPQSRPLAWPNTVRDVVALGRFAYGGPLARSSRDDAAAVTRALQACGLEALSGRRTDTLSGGELARVHCARAFAAETPLMIADEPTAALDPRQAFTVLDLLRDYVAAGGGALVVLHDIALAARYATRLVWMKDGRILADGPPDATLTSDRLADIYGVRADVVEGRVTLRGAL